MVTTAEKPRSHSTEKTKETKEVVVLPEETKAPVKAETEKKLSKEPTNIFPKTSLNRIGVKPSKAKELAKEVLGVSTIELPETVEYIKEFQRKNKLDQDGQVGAKTYEKMKEISDKSDVLVKQVEKGFNEYGLSEKTLREISKLLPNMMLQSSNYRKILFYVGKFQTCSKFDSKKTPEVKDLLREIGGQTNEDKKVLEKAEKAQSIYQIGKDIKNGKISAKEGFEKIIKDPTLLMVGGLLFLFGVIGSNSKYTNSFMKRIGWIMGIGLFGKAAWNKFGLGEMINDAEKAGSSIIDSVKKGAEKAKPAVEDFFKKDLAEMWKSVKDFDFSKIWEGISSKYDKLTSGFASYNETFKDKDGKAKEGYIKEKPLVALTSLMSDEKFLNTSRTDLVKISDITSLNGVITEKTQKILSDAGISKTDVNNFIHKHLLKNSFGKEKDAKLVKDLLFSTSIKEKLVEQVVKSGEYVDDETLNKEINSQILVLVNSSDAKKKNLGIELAKAIKFGKIDEFNLDNFGITDTTKIKKLIDKVKNYNKFKEELKDKISEVEDINPIISSNLDKATIKTIIQGDLAELEKITLESNFDTSKFDKAKNEKIKELLELAISSGVGSLVTVDGKNAEEYMGKIEKKESIIKDKETVEKINFNDIPGVGKSPNDFYAYLEANKENFKKVKDLYEKYKDKTTNKEKEVLTIITQKEKEIEQFKKNYETVRGKIEDKVNELKTKVVDIKTDENQDFITQKKALDKLAREYSQEIMIKVFKINSPDLSTIKNIWNQLNTDLVLLNTTVNSIKKVDKFFDINKDDINFDIGVKQKREELEKNYKIKIDINTLDPLDENSVEKVLKEIQKQHILIATNFEFKKDKKLGELKDIVGKVQEKFIAEIETAMDLEALEKILKNYKILKKNTGTYTDKNFIDSWINMLGKNDKVEEKYEERVKEIQRQEFLIKTYKDPKVNKLILSSGIIDLFEPIDINKLSEVQKEINQNEDLMNIWTNDLNDNTNLRDLLQTLEQIKDKTINPYGLTDKTINKFQDIYNNIKNGINTELNGVFDTYLKKIKKLTK